MSDKNSATADAAVGRSRINAETAKIPWQELQRFFAQGRAVAVASELDLVEVAWEMSRDNSAAMAVWVEGGQVCQVTDAQAMEWLDSKAIMWCVVVKPWVLVQALPDGVVSD